MSGHRGTQDLDAIADGIRRAAELQLTKPYDVACAVAVALGDAGYRIVRKPGARGRGRRLVDVFAAEPAEEPILGIPYACAQAHPIKLERVRPGLDRWRCAGCLKRAQQRDRVRVQVPPGGGA